MTTNSIVTNPVSQDLFSFVFLHFEVVRLPLDGMRPDQFSMIVQNGDSGLGDSEASGGEKDIVVVVALRRVDGLSHGGGGDIGRAVRVEREGAIFGLPRRSVNRRRVVVQADRIGEGASQKEQDEEQERDRSHGRIVVVVS